MFPSYDDWGVEGEDTGLYEKLLRVMVNVENSLKSYIRTVFQGSTVMHLLAIEMLAASTKFLRELFSYMGNTYIHLFSAFNDGQAAWELVCFAVLEIFSNDFQPEKVDMATADIVGDVPQCAATVFWTNLKLVSVAEKYTEVGIKNHPSMNSAYIRFILSQSSQRKGFSALESKVKTQDETIISLKRSISEMQESVKSFTGKVKHLESTLDSTKNKAAALEKDVKRLKSKGGGSE